MDASALKCALHELQEHLDPKDMAPLLTFSRLLAAECPTSITDTDSFCLGMCMALLVDVMPAGTTELQTLLDRARKGLRSATDKAERAKQCAVDANCNAGH